MSPLEIIAALFGFACVFLLMQRNPWSWPIGLVQVGLYVFVFANAKLYADMALHVVYIFLQFYGWHAWLSSLHQAAKETTQVPPSRIQVRRLESRGWLACIAVTLMLSVLFSWILQTFTDAVAPVPDSLIAAASLVAQFLLAWRYLETWLFWILVDIVGIGLFASRGMIPTTILYAAFGVMAVLGWITWMKSYHFHSPMQVER